MLSVFNRFAHLRIIVLLAFSTFPSSYAFSADLDFSWSKVQGAAGVEYFSNTYKRGILTYGSGQLIPIYSIDLGTPDIQFAGSSFTFRSFLIDDKLLFRSRIFFDSTFDQPLYFSAEKENDRVRREATNELDLFLEYRFRHRGELTLMLSQDLTAHSGTYAEFGFRAILANLKPKNNSFLIQPAFFASIGGGNTAHNKYFYGDGASDWSFSNYSMGFSISSPAVIDILYPVLKITYFGLLGDDNQTASYVKKGETTGWNVIALVAFRVF